MLSSCSQECSIQDVALRCVALACASTVQACMAAAKLHQQWSRCSNLDCASHTFADVESDMNRVGLFAPGAEQAGTVNYDKNEWRKHKNIKIKKLAWGTLAEAAVRQIATGRAELPGPASTCMDIPSEPVHHLSSSLHMCQGEIRSQLGTFRRAQLSPSRPIRDNSVPRASI